MVLSDLAKSDGARPEPFLLLGSSGLTWANPRPPKAKSIKFIQPSKAQDLLPPSPSPLPQPDWVPEVLRAEGPADVLAGNLRPTGTPPVLFLAVAFRLVCASSISDSVKSGEALRFFVVFIGAISPYFGLRKEDKNREGVA